MTIRQRQIVSILGVLILFATTQAVYFWSSRLRARTMETLHQIQARQVLINTIWREVDNLHKEITLLSQITFEEGGMGPNQEERRVFGQRTVHIAELIEQVRSIADPSHQAQIDELAETFKNLAAAWQGFYENLGVEQVFVLAHLIRADPLSNLLLIEQIPGLNEAEGARLVEAEARFEEVDQLTERLTLIIFALSVVVALAVAYRFSHYLVGGLDKLKLGATAIGSGKLDHRIRLETRDELGNLASAFNDMAENLSSAHAQLTQANHDLELRHQEVEKQRHVSESLLHNILPVEVAKELRTNGKVDPRYFEDVTILFTDFVGFTLSTETMAAEELVYSLHDYFTAFDQITTRYQLEKLKTIGDSFMCGAGFPVRNSSHPVDAVMAALEMLQAVKERDRADNKARWKVRIGIHTGPVIAGVVGTRKFTFDIWGDSVNYASRIESSGAPNRINLSEQTYFRVKDFFDCEYRGKVLTKENKESPMYFVSSILPTLLNGGLQVPHEPFLRRYRVYFQKDPPAFPAFLLEPARTTAG